MEFWAAITGFREGVLGGRPHNSVIAGGTSPQLEQVAP